MQHRIHGNDRMKFFQNNVFKAESLDALRAQVIEACGPFPILFYPPAQHIGETPIGPGIVLTAIVDIPGAELRNGVFLGAQMMGYVPAVKDNLKSPMGNGLNIVPIGVLKTEAWFTHTVPTEVEKPYEAPAT